MAHPPQNPAQKPPPQQLPPIAGYQILDVCCPHCRLFAPQYYPTGFGTANLVCYWCGQQFFSQVVEIRAKRSQGYRNNNTRNFQVRVTGAQGVEQLIQFDSQFYEDFELRSKDKAIFSYVGNFVFVVQNLSVSQLYFTRSLNKNCYVATCVYGEGSCEVATLRAFRDEKLLPNRLGAVFVKLYYAVSPYAVRQFGNASIFRKGALVILQPLVVLIARSARRRHNKRL